MISYHIRCARRVAYIIWTRQQTANCTAAYCGALPLLPPTGLRTKSARPSVKRYERGRHWYPKRKRNRKKRRIWWSQTPNSVSANKIRPEGNAVIQKIKKGLLPPFAQPRKGKSFFRGSPNPLPPKLPISPEILRGSKQRKLRKNTEKLVFS